MKLTSVKVALAFVQVEEVRNCGMNFNKEVGGFRERGTESEEGETFWTRYANEILERSMFSICDDKR